MGNPRRSLAHIKNTVRHSLALDIARVEPTEIVVAVSHKHTRHALHKVRTVHKLKNALMLLLDAWIQIVAAQGVTLVAHGAFYLG